MSKDNDIRHSSNTSINHIELKYNIEKNVKKIIFLITNIRNSFIFIFYLNNIQKHIENLKEVFQLFRIINSLVDYSKQSILQIIWTKLVDTNIKLIKFQKKNIEFDKHIILNDLNDVLFRFQHEIL